MTTISFESITKLHKESAAQSFVERR